MKDEIEKLYKKIMNCRGCDHKGKDGPYQICGLVPMFYPNAPLASIAQGQCVNDSKYEMFDLYMEMIEEYNSAKLTRI